MIFTKTAVCFSHNEKVEEDSCGRTDLFSETAIQRNVEKEYKSRSSNVRV